jgi:hypothetical protein
MDLFLPTTKSPGAAPSSGPPPPTSPYYAHYDPPSELGGSSSPQPNHGAVASSQPNYSGSSSSQPNYGGSVQPAPYVFPPRSATQPRTTLVSAGQSSESVSLLGAPSQKVLKSPPKTETNEPDEAPVTVVLAQTSPLPPRAGNSWLLFLLLLLLLIIAAAIAQRCLARNKGNERSPKFRN